MIGQTVSHYRILSKLGHGGMGVVYLAEDTHLSRRVAIKFSTAPPENVQYRARFLREARAASALNHPHIAGIYDYGEAPDGQPFIVMELVAGEDLFHLLRRGEMSVNQALRIAESVAGALGEAHRHEIVHRDIKPANILLNERGEVKVLDFGLAKRMDDIAPAAGENPTLAPSGTMEGTVLGTPQYMSPEQARDESLGAASDLFALGSVLYECLAGRPAFSGGNSVEILAAVLHVDPPPPSRFNPQVTAEMDRIVAKALSKKQEQRYQSADLMAEDLRAARASLVLSQSQETELLAVPGPPHTSSLTETLKSLAALTAPLRRSRWGAVITLALVVAILAAAWWFLPFGSYQPAPGAQRWYQEGLTALHDGTYYKASKALEQAVSLAPGYALAHAHLAEAWMELDYGDKAKDEMLRAVPPGSRPRLTSADESYLEGLNLTLTGDFSGAIPKYREMVNRAPDAAKSGAYVDLGRAYEKTEDMNSAVAAYQESIRLQPQDPASWLRIATLYGRQMDQSKALQAFDQAETLYRGLSNLEGVAEVLYQRGVFANRLGRTAEARSLLQRAMELSRSIGSSSQEIVVLIQLSNISHRMDDAVEAQAFAAQALDLARSNGMEGLTTRGLIDLGNAYFAKGENAQARQYFTQSLEYARRYRAQRSEARALLSLGSLEMQVGETDAGLRDVQQGLNWYQRGGYRKETAQALILIARAEREVGNYPASIQSFQQQLQIARTLGDQSQVTLAEQGIGTVLAAQGRWPEALASYRQENEAARLSGAQVFIQYSQLHCAEALYHLGRADEARKFLDQIPAGASPAVQSQVEENRAGIALTERRFRLVMEVARRVLAQPGINNQTTARMKTLLGLAQAASGGARDGAVATGEALALAEKSGNPSLLAEARLAYADALVEAGEASKGLETVLTAEQWFERAAAQEQLWRCRMIAATAEAALREPAKARESAGKAAELLAGLEQKWDSVNYATYVARPDVQYRRSRLSRLAAK